MKKFLTFGLALAMIIPCVFMATGCGPFGTLVSKTALVGSYYKLTDVKVEFETEYLKEVFEDQTGITAEEYVEEEKAELWEDCQAIYIKFVQDEDLLKIEVYKKVNNKLKKNYDVPNYFFSLQDNYIYVWEDDKNLEGFPDGFLKTESNNKLSAPYFGNVIYEHGMNKKVIFTLDSSIKDEPVTGGQFEENVFYQLLDIEIEYSSNSAKRDFEDLIGMTTQEYIDFQKASAEGLFYRFNSGYYEGEGIMEMWMEVDGYKQKYENPYQPIQYYTVDGDQIKVWMGDETKTGNPDGTVKIEGNNLVFEDTQEGVTIKRILTKE